jgi:Mg2+ and Co2+ transporter CorA
MVTRTSFLNASLDFLKHPLLLLIAGSIIGSILIPRISEKASHARALQDARLRKAVDIIDNNTRTISQLNALRTRLGMFHTDNVRLSPAPAKLDALRDKLSADMNDRYLEFEKNGWWWYRDLNDEAVVLEIVPPTGSDKLRSDVNAYHKNILDTVKLLNEMWHACVDARYDYKDPHVTQIQENMNKEWDNLTNARNQAVNDLVADFTQPH